VRFPKLRYAILVGAALGVIAPLLFFTWHRFQGFITSGDGGFLWPSGIWLMATDGHEHEFGAYIVIGFSILANVLLYAAIAAVFWFILRTIQRVATRTS
jgi:hypothetical protein